MRNSTEIAKVSYLVNVEAPGVDVKACQGVLLGSSWVFTSCQCVPVGSCKRLEVRVSASFPKTGGTVYKVNDCKSHWNRRSKINYANMVPKHNVCLLHLEKPILFDLEVYPAIGFKVGEFPKGNWALLHGYGVNSLEIVQLPIIMGISYDECKYHYRDLGGVPDGMFCAGDNITTPVHRI